MCWKRSLASLLCLLVPVLVVAQPKAPPSPTPRTAPTFQYTVPVPQAQTGPALRATPGTTAPTTRLAWDYPTGTLAEGFQLHRCTASTVTTDCVPTTSVVILWDANARTWTDSGVDGGARYCWTVRAVRHAGEPSPMSTAACATITTTPSPGPGLVAPTNLHVVP
jgi:hypothetical protein